MSNRAINGSRELLVVTPLTAHRSRAGNLVLTRKFIEGMRAYAERWPGEVTAMFRLAKTPSNNLDHMEYESHSEPFHAELQPTDRARLHERMRAALFVLGGPLGVPGVTQAIVTITTLRTRWQIIAAEAPSILRRSKRSIEAGVREWFHRGGIRHLAGVQCNGTPTYDSYRHLNSNTILFFDSRMGERDLICEKDMARRNESLINKSRLRLVFSGRLMRIKGVDALPEIAAELRRLGVKFEMNIIGDGESRNMLEDRIRKLHLSDRVIVHGNLDYRSELLPIVRGRSDLFICTHIQGDPSHTYLETMGCGVPIIGYANEAWAGMARLSKAGWTTQTRRPELLAAKIAELDQNRDQIVRASHAARRFAAEHLFEKTMDRRVEHMLSCLDSRRSDNGNGACSIPQGP